MLRQLGVNNTAIGSQEFIIRLNNLIQPLAFGYFEHRSQTVGHRFIRSENPEVAVRLITQHNLFQIFPENSHILCYNFTWNRVIQCIVSKVRQVQVFDQVAGVGHRIHAHTSVAGRKDFGKLCIQTAILIE
ncbi:hypothetical protein D3C73_1124360 [compost metagenome]